MSLTIERWWILIGAVFGIVPLIGLAKTNVIDIQVLSIFFGALLAIAAIIYSAWESETLRNLRKSGHDKYLIEYIIVPSYLCFVLIVMQLLKESIYVSTSLPFYSVLVTSFSVITYGIGGIFVLSMLRILILLEPIMSKR
jgi:hypothetical protein